MRFHLISAFVTFFVVVDPVGVAVVTGGMTHGLPRALRHSIAWRGVATAGVILIVFAFVGEALLRALGITLPALRVAGGLLLFLLSIDMVFARPSGYAIRQVRSRRRPTSASILRCFRWPFRYWPGRVR